MLCIIFANMMQWIVHSATWNLFLLSDTRRGRGEGDFQFQDNVEIHSGGKLLLTHVIFPPDSEGELWGS